MSSPDLSEVRVQHLTRLEMSSPDLSEVRVRPHKRSGANWALTRDRTRTGRSQEIAPGLEASNQVRDV